MPYHSIEDLPARVKSTLPQHAQEIYVEAFNHAHEEYKDPEKRRGHQDLDTVAHKVAWAAVKTKYERDAVTGKWHAKK